MPPVDPDVAQAVLVFRNGLDVDILELAGGTGPFVSALQTGQTVLEAAGVASSDDPEFDLSYALALLLRWQLITHLTTGNEHHEHPH